LRMIQGMDRTGRKDWTVYILLCGDGSFYTGIAKDVQTRVKQHSEGRGITLRFQKRGNNDVGINDELEHTQGHFLALDRR